MMTRNAADQRRPDADALSQVTGDPATSVGLPNAAYTEPAYLQRERRSVIAPGWIGIGLVDDLPEPGSVFPTRAAGQPLLVTRDHDSELRVFHNVCRHRGTQLLDKAGTCRTIVCPYHAWTYDLDGQLLKTPHFEGFGSHGPGAIDASTYGLVPVRSAVWNHILFVNLSGDAPPFERWIARLDERWSQFDFGLLRYGHEARHELDVNWKLITENFLESYHLPTVHRELNQYSALEHHELILEGQSFFGQQSANYVPADGAAGALPCFPGLADTQARAAEYVCLFPTVWLSCTADHFRVTLVEPVSPTRTRLRWMFFFVGEAAMVGHLDDTRQALVDRVLSVFDEDVAILNRLQAGRTSGGFDGGRFSAFHEPTSHRFQHMIASRLLADTALSHED